MIFCSRLTRRSRGTASAELELPNGGLAYVIGNVIQRVPRPETDRLYFGTEGYRTETNQLDLINNTLVDMRPQDRQFLQMKSRSGNLGRK